MNPTANKSTTLASLELVVARYHEDLQWLRRVPRHFQITVYNKGGMLDPPPRRRAVQVRALPDIGREDFSYLHHLVERYESLADVTVFAQGKPFDHVPDYHKILHAIGYHQLSIENFRWFGFILDEDDSTGSILFRHWSKNPTGEALPMQAFWRMLRPGLPMPDRFVFYPGAHFAVTAAQIRQQPRSFYEDALTISSEMRLAGHCFERVWDQVFGVDGIPEPYRHQPRPIYFRPTRAQAAQCPVLK